MVHISCKKLIGLFIAIPLLIGVLGVDNSSNAQWRARRGGCENGQCNVPKRDSWHRKPDTSGYKNQPKSTYATRSFFKAKDGTTHQKMGFGTAVRFEGNFYIITCAHVWGTGDGFTDCIVVNGKNTKIEILYKNRDIDLAILKAPPGLITMPLSLKLPGKNKKLTMGYRRGTMLGFARDEIVCSGYVQNGDSGGPIFDETGLLGVIATYTYDNDEVYAGRTAGPCASRIAKILRGLRCHKRRPPTGPAPTVPHEPPMVPLAPIPQPQEDSALRSDLDTALARISNLEAQIAELPQTGNCELVQQRLDSFVQISKTNDLASKRRMDGLEKCLRENALGLQRIAGAVESMQKEVVAQNKRIGVLDQSGKTASLRIQRLESSTAALTNSIKTTNDKLSGKLRFRLSVDQAGRVVGVNAQ